jgi:hypothetical protein
MKSTILIYLIFLVLSINFSGCISLHNGDFIQPNIPSNKENFRIIKTIRGEASATYILGIGGNLKDGLINEAKINMYGSHELKPNQNITNITKDIKKAYFIIPILYMSETVIVSADIIEFYDREENKILEATSIKNLDDKMVENTENEFRDKNIDVFNDTTKCNPYKNIGEVRVGDKILIKNSRGIIINGTVSKIPVNNIIEYKYLKNTGQYFINEIEIQNVRKIR